MAAKESAHHGPGKFFMFSPSDRVPDSVSGDVGDSVLTQACFIAGGTHTGAGTQFGSAQENQTGGR